MPPYIQDLNYFIYNISIKEKKNKELLYFKNLRDVDLASTVFQIVLWVLVIVFTFVYWRSEGVCFPSQ